MREGKQLLVASTLLLTVILLCASKPAYSVSVWGPDVVVAKIEGTIDQGVVGYVKEAMAYAESIHAPLVIYLDTPGGYLEAALSIVDMIDESRVPVIAYAGGRWAVSAGTLILVSSPLAYAAPRTVIGSMQPVILTPEGVKPLNESKVINTLLKILEVHCEAYGRNFTAVREFVLHNLNFDGEEAVRYHVIDGVASSIEDLVVHVNGARVTLYNGRVVELSLKGRIIYYEMPLRYRIVRVFSDPTVSSLLFSLGSLIIIIALASGHLHYAAFGLFLLLLGLFGLGYSVNMLAVALIIIGAILLAIDLAVIPGFGVVGATGALMLILGFVLLPFSGTMLVSREVVETLLYTAVSIGIFFGVLSGVVAYKVAGSIRRPPILKPIPIGKTGRAVDELRPDREGFVLIEGEYWRAVAKQGVIKPGELVRVVGKEGPVLIVEKVEGRPGKFSSSEEPSVRE